MPLEDKFTTKNRGALSNPEGRFETTRYEHFADGWDLEEETLPEIETFLLSETAKSIISHNDSPDLPFEQSINPYRGCEHGCIYCYARPSHAYVNLSPGIDFETKIFYKENAAQLLSKTFEKASYRCKTIVLGANTDPYQPAEASLKITRSLLEVFKEYKHPVSIITKNSLIERDLDLLTALAKDNLVSVALSVTTLSKELKRTMEPRTSMPTARLRAIKRLTEHGIPVRVLVAPVIPMINDIELEKILEAVSQAGAKHANYVLLRLPHEVKDLFREWLDEHFPQRASHVMSLIQQMRGGKDYDSTFGKRMSGEGIFASLLKKRFHLACQRYHLNKTPAQALNVTQFERKMAGGKQLLLWDEMY